MQLDRGASALVLTMNDRNGNAPSSVTRHTVLCIGIDPALLSYRAEVLVKAGFHVVCANPRSEEGVDFGHLCRLHRPALAIVCHTLYPRQRIALAAHFHEQCPSMKLLALTNGQLAPDEAAGFDRVLDSLDGPAALIHHIQLQLNG